jgi:hypothetical protein
MFCMDPILMSRRIVRECGYGKLYDLDLCCDSCGKAMRGMFSRSVSYEKELQRNGSGTRRTWQSLGYASQSMSK